MNTILEWQDVETAARTMQIHPRSFRKLIASYEDKLQDYLKYEKSRGTKGKKLLINKDGLVILATMKSNTSIRHEKYLIAKKQIAEKAIKQVRTPMVPTVTTLSPALALQQAVNLMVEQEKKLNQMEQRQTQVEQRILQLTNSLDGDTKLTTAQRARLNDRVRALAFHVGHSRNETAEYWFRRLWRKLHDCMRKTDIEAYYFEDFPTAIETLKTFYVEYGLTW
jgi:hypothetical protein